MNPFRPSLGSSPPELIGRQALLDAIADGIADGPGAPSRISIFTGARGVGKTVMLNEVESTYDAAGWRHVSLTAQPGFLRELSARVAEFLAGEEAPPGGRVTGIRGPGGIGIDLERPRLPDPDLRSRVEGYLDLVAGRGSGLLVTLDEVQGGRPEELRAFGVLVQHLVRDDRQFAVAMAGLGSAVSDLLNDDVLTFLRRADRHPLGSLDVEDVEDALHATFEANGRTLDEESCVQAAHATLGYPFLVQLVGYHVWRSTRARHLAEPSVTRGVAAARERLRTLVHEPALYDLSDQDRAFVAAMAVDAVPSRIADVATRMERSAQYVNTYRTRLIAAGIIESPARGRVSYAIPHLRATVLAMRDEGTLPALS